MEKKFIKSTNLSKTSKLLIIALVLAMLCIAIALPLSQASADVVKYKIGEANYVGSYYKCYYDINIYSAMIDTNGETDKLSSSGFALKLVGIGKKGFTTFNYNITFDLVKNNEVIASYRYVNAVKNPTGNTYEIFSADNLRGSGTYVILIRGSITSHATENIFQDYTFVVV